jgi:plastocyanin
MFSSDQMAQGDTFSFTFEKPGTFYYMCIIHASLETMHAVVIVK